MNNNRNLLSLPLRVNTLNMIEETNAYLITKTNDNSVKVAYNKATIGELLGITRQAVQALIKGDESYHKKSKSTIKRVILSRKLTNRVGRASNFEGKKSI